MHRLANLKPGLAAALISLTVALVALAVPLTALAGNGCPGGVLEQHPSTKGLALRGPSTLGR